MTSCQQCDKTVPTRVEKIVVPMLLDLINFPPSATDDILLGGQGCSEKQRRPDTLWIGEDRAISVEIDERGGHPDREPSCEIDKMQGQAQSLYILLGRVVPVYYVRFNPDESDCGTPLGVRIARVASRVNELISMPAEDEGHRHTVFVEYHYYHSKCLKHIHAAQQASLSLTVLSPAIGHLFRTQL